MVSILDLFPEEIRKQKNDKNWQTECPCCGLQGGRTEGFILFPENNMAYCHSSGKHFNWLETYALKKKIIRCLDGHESGDKKHILDKEQYKEVLDLMREEYGEEGMNKILIDLGIKKPEICLPSTGKLVSDFAKELSEYLKKEDVLFYRPEIGDIVEVGKIKLHKNGEDFYRGFVTIKPSRFITLCESYVQPGVKIEIKLPDLKNPLAKTKKLIIFAPKSMSADIANTVLASQQLQQPLQQIDRIFTVPIPIMHEGSLTFPKHGFDERFGSWMGKDAPELSNPNMTLEEAKKVLFSVYGEFCFKTKQDYINAIAGLLTPYLRGLYSNFNVRTPIFFYLANRERAGKDYCAGVTGMTFEGNVQEDTPISNSENSRSSNTDELRKKITAALMSGRKRMHFSNNKGYINNAVIESVATNTKYVDRVLGKNELASMDNEMDFSLSGNVGVGYTPDFANRCRFVRLFLELEDANARKFTNPDLHSWVKVNRGLILSALYALVKNWIEKGQPAGNIPFTSYPEWAKICGGIMEAAGYDSPCNPDKETLSLSGDSETGDMKQLFELCFEKHPEEWINKNSIKDIAQSEEAEHLFSYVDFDKKSDQIKFGQKILKFVGRVLSDIRLVVKDSSARAARQEFKFTKEVAARDLKEVFGQVGNDGNVGNDEPPKNLFENKKNNIGKCIANITKITNITKKKPVSERKTQFYESSDTQDIKSTVNTEQVLESLKTAPTTYQELYNRFGVGFLKVKNELVAGGKIKQDGEMLILI